MEVPNQIYSQKDFYGGNCKFQIDILMNNDTAWDFPSPDFFSF